MLLVRVWGVAPCFHPGFMRLRCNSILCENSATPHFVRVCNFCYLPGMNTPKRQPKQERMPQAPRSPLPELAEFLAPLRVQFTQGPSAATLRQ
jgi:hypothetical protein